MSLPPSIAHAMSIDWNGQQFVLSVRNELSQTFQYAHSPDGVNWTYTSLPNDLSANSNVYDIQWMGDNVFSVGGHLVSSRGNGNVVVSVGLVTDDANSVHATSYPLSANNQDFTALYAVESGREFPHRIVFPASTVLALRNDSSGCRIAISSDEGATWESAGNAAQTFPNGVNDAVWNGRIWVGAAATGPSNNGNLLATSLDGRTWTPRGGPLHFTTCHAVVHTTSHFLGFGADTRSNTCVLARSYDGIYWHQLFNNTLFRTNATMDLGWNERVLVAVGTPDTSNNSIAYSTNNGTTWSFPSQSNLFSASATRVFYNVEDNLWTVVGSDSPRSNINVAESTDGITWQVRYAADLSAIVQKLESGRHAATIVTPDASLITPTRYVDNNATHATATIQPISLAGGEGENTLAYSVDGTLWTPVPQSPFTKCNRIVWNGSLWVGVGSCIAVSLDGLDWTLADSSLFTECMDIAWNGEWFVAVGYHSGNAVRMARSRDGTQWSAVSNVFDSSSNAATVIEWTGRAWIAYGSNGVSAVSSATDAAAATWTTTTHLYVLDASNLCGDVSATVSATTNTGNAGNAVDGSDNTFWESNTALYNNLSNGVYVGTSSMVCTDASGTLTVSGEWLQIDFSGAVTVAHYSVGAVSNTACPRAWKLVASNDQTAWTVLDSFSASLATGVANMVWPLHIANTTAYSSYRLVLTATFGATNVQISEWKLLNAGNTPLNAPYNVRPIVLKEYVLHPFHVANENRTVCTITDLSGTVVRDAAVNAGYYAKTLLNGLTTRVSGHAFDGTQHIACSASGELSFLTNAASYTNLSWSATLLSQNPISSRSSIHGACFNTKHVLLAGNTGISYGSFGADKQYPAVFYETNAGTLFTNIHCVSSNSGHGHVIPHNTLYFDKNDLLALTTPKYYSEGDVLSEKAQISFAATRLP